MKYKLSIEQWNILFGTLITDWECTGYEPEYDHLDTYSYALEIQIERNNRKIMFQNMFPSLQYNENYKRHSSDKYWGTIVGNEKDLTLFLLKLL